MKNSLHTLMSAALLAGLSAASLHGAQLLVNGGFESGFTSWTRSDQLGSEGGFSLQTGTLTPLSGLTVPAPPGPSTAAMSDAAGPGSHVLYQDFVVPTVVPGALASFSLFIGNRGTAFFSPATLDFTTPALNQQVRVDIVRATADAFSVAAADVLQNLYQSAPGDPLVSGYTAVSRDISALLAANAGQTLRLRFAAVDNVFILNAGIDQVSVETFATAIPEPSTWLLVTGAIAGFCLRRVRRG